MIESRWLVETLGEMIGDLRHAAGLVQAKAVAVGVPSSGMLEPDQAYQVLDRIKAEEAGLPATAASTLKVRIMMLLTTRTELAV